MLVACPPLVTARVTRVARLYYIQARPPCSRQDPNLATLATRGRNKGEINGVVQLLRARFQLGPMQWKEGKGRERRADGREGADLEVSHKGEKIGTRRNGPRFLEYSFERACKKAKQSVRREEEKKQINANNARWTERA